MDPKPQTNVSDYATFKNNSVMFIDKDGAKPTDWFKDSKGNIRWDNSKASNITKDGKSWSNIGSTLNIQTTSFIPGIRDDEQGNDLGVSGGNGDKLTTYVQITGNYDKAGKFTKFTTTFDDHKGASFGAVGLLQGADGVEGKSEQAFEGTTKSGTYYAFIERHTEVNYKEKLGLKAYTGGLVDVNQAITFNIKKDGELVVNIGHGTYPSIKMSVAGDYTYYRYGCQSFINSHGSKPSIMGINPIFEQNAIITQSISDALNKKYRDTNKGNFKGFTAAPNGWEYSKLYWFKYPTK